MLQCSPLYFSGPPLYCSVRLSVNLDKGCGQPGLTPAFWVTNTLFQCPRFHEAPGCRTCMRHTIRQRPR